MDIRQDRADSCISFRTQIAQVRHFCLTDRGSAGSSGFAHDLRRCRKFPVSSANRPISSTWLCRKLLKRSIDTGLLAGALPRRSHLERSDLIDKLHAILRSRLRSVGRACLESAINSVFFGLHRNTLGLWVAGVKGADSSLTQPAWLQCYALPTDFSAMTVSTPHAGAAAFTERLLPGERSHDAAMVRLAIAAAEQRAVRQVPILLVGAVIVDESVSPPQVLATGFHAQAGRAHAEVDALQKLAQTGASATKKDPIRHARAV